MKPIFKKRILLNKNLHLADLLYFQDHRGRYSFKCSFKNKISPLRTWKKHYGGLEKLDFTHPHTEKIVDGGESLEISFKFDDNKLEVKREIKGGSIERTFYSVITPISRHLFTLIVRNQDLLSIVEPTSEDFIVDHPELNNQIALVFSFEGADGKPFMDTMVNAYVGKQYLIKLPGQKYERLHLAVVKDSNPIPNASNCITAIPYDPIK